MDTHCHLDLPPFDAGRSSILRQAAAAGVEAVIVPAIAADGLHNILRLAQDYPIVSAGAGLHPLFMDWHHPDDWSLVQQQVENGSVVAIGECGLDFSKASTDKPAQRKLFEQHVELAQSSGLPLIIHAHRAVEDVLQCVQRYPGVNGVVHSFNGSEQQAKSFIDIGFKLGFGGAITYPRATRLRQMITNLPLDALLLETDAPYQTGFAHKGQVNQPAWISEVCEVVAKLQDLPQQLIAEKTTANAVDLFKIALVKR